MVWTRCGVCDIEFFDEKQEAKCPHLSLSRRPERKQSVPRRQRPSEPFPAQYDGMCHGCWCEIEAGDEIVMWNGHAHHNDENCCDGLAEESAEEVADRLKDRWE